MSDLKAAFAELEKTQLLAFGHPGAYCELLDENDPNGPVVFRQASGVEYMIMPREVYEDLLNYKEGPKIELKCDHNWVLDGHNCGEDICSKCFKRE